MSATWEDLAGALRGIPELPGAACAGAWELFDPKDDDEDAEDLQYRHSAAVRMCLSDCPCLAACRSWVASLPPSKRPVGVVAGEVRRPSFERRKAS